MDEVNKIFSSLYDTKTNHADHIDTFTVLMWLIVTTKVIIVSDVDLNMWHADYIQVLFKVGCKLFNLPAKTIVKEINWNMHTQDKAVYHITFKSFMEQEVVATVQQMTGYICID